MVSMDVFSIVVAHSGFDVLEHGLVRELEIENG